MKERWPIVILSTIGLAALTSIAAVWLRPVEPQYQGRPLSYWSALVQTPDSSRFEAYQALRAIGSEAVPFLVNELKSQGSFSRRLYRAAWELIPTTLQNHAPKPKPQSDSLFFWTSELLGVCAPASELARLLRDPHVEVRLAATWALMKSLNTPLSPETAAAAATLLTDSSADVRASAALLLGQAGTNRAEVLEILVQSLADSHLRAPVQRNLRLSAPAVLGQFGPNASEAVPELSKLLGDPQTLVRIPAALALWRINRTSNVVDLLVTEFDRASQSKKTEDWWVCDQILGAVHELGQGAKPMQENIERLIEFPRRSWPPSWRTNLLQKAQSALRELDPEAALRVKPRDR